MKIIYPTKLSEIPLGNYQKWMKVVDNSNDEELMAHKFLEIFLGVDLNDARRMSVKDVNFFINKVVSVLNTKPRFQKRWKYGAHEFGLISDFENMSWVEYIDIEQNMSKVETWHKALAVLYRPIVKTFKDTYEIMEYKGDDEFHDPMKYCNLDVALGVQVFFWNLEKELLNNTLSSLEAEMKTIKLTKKEKTALAKVTNSANNGAGITHYIDYVRETLETLPKLRPYPYIKLSLSSRMKSKKKKSNTITIEDN